jgi:hypothetical protein
MMKRVFWVALGASAGVLLVVQGKKVLRRFTPAALADSASAVPEAVTGRIREFADEIRLAAADREFELYQALGVDLPDDEPRDAAR